MVEGLVGEPFPVVICAGMHLGAVDQQPQCGGEVSAGAFVVVPLGFQAFGDVSQSDPDPVLVAFQRR